MFEVFVWVPTKGWKIVLKTKNGSAAREAFDAFQPLEVKLCENSRPVDFGGVLCQPQYDLGKKGLRAYLAAPPPTNPALTPLAHP